MTISIDSSTMPLMKNIKGIVFALMGGCLWGVNGTMVQLLYTKSDISSAALTCIRSLSAGIILLLIMLAVKGRHIFDIFKNRRDALLLVLYGVFGLAMVQLSYMTSIAYTDAGTATVLQSFSIILITIVGCIQSRRKPVKTEIIAMILAVTGVFLVTTQGDFRSLSISGKGLFWAGINVIAVTVYTVLPVPLVKKYDPFLILAWGLVIGGILLNLIIRPFRELSGLSFTPAVILIILFIILAGTIAAFGLYTEGVKHVGAVYSGLLSVSEPFTAALLAAFLLHTGYSLITIIGFVFILSTVFILSISSAKTKKA